MFGPRSRWRILLFASIPVVAAGMALAGFSSDSTWRSAGLVVFVVGAGIYITARVGQILEDRRR